MSEGPTDEEIETFRNRPPDRDETAEAYAGVTLAGVASLWKMQLGTNAARGEKGKTTQWTDEKNLRGFLRLVPNEKMPLAELTEGETHERQLSSSGPPS